MKKISCVESGVPVTEEEINAEIKRVGINEMGIKLPAELIDFYINQNISFTYHRVIKTNYNEYDIGYFCEMIREENFNKNIIELIKWFSSFDDIGKYNMIVFNMSTGGDLFYISYGKNDYGKVYHLSMDEGEDSQPDLLANSFGEFIDALEVDPEDMEDLMALPEDKRGDLT